MRNHLPEYLQIVVEPTLRNSVVALIVRLHEISKRLSRFNRPQPQGPLVLIAGRKEFLYLSDASLYERPNSFLQRPLHEAKVRLRVPDETPERKDLERDRHCR